MNYFDPIHWIRIKIYPIHPFCWPLSYQNLVIFFIIEKQDQHFFPIPLIFSGAHTIGKARCRTFRSRLQTSSNIDFVASLQQLCSGPDTVAHLDLATPATFDNQYFVNLLSGEGLLPSDQALVNGNDQTRQIVETYVENPLAFFEDFKLSMLKMGSLASPTQTNGQIRRNCRTIN